jgi:hypothetical protein
MGINREMGTGDTVNYYTTNVVQDPKQANTGLIQLEDGSLVEVQMPEYKAGEISAGFAQRTVSTFSRVEGILCNAAEPIVKAAKRISESENVSVTAEVEVGLSFEAEGSVYVTKNKSDANLVVKLSIHASSSAS